MQRCLLPGLLVLAVMGGPPAGEPAPAVTTTIADLLSQVRTSALVADAVGVRRQAAAARHAVASAWEDPELELRLGRERARTGGDQAATWGAGIRQRLEITGVRSGRIAAARAAGQVAAGESAEIGLDLEAAIRRLAVETAAAQAGLAQAEGVLRLAEEMTATAERLAGEAGKADLVRVRLEVVTARTEVQARRQAVTAQHRLWSSYGILLAEGTTVTDALPEAPKPMTLEAAMSGLDGHPRLRRLAAEEAQRTAELAQARRARIPSPVLGLEFDREAESDRYGLSLGISLPVLGGTGAAVALAESERLRSGLSLRRERAELERATILAWTASETARQEATTLSSEARPLAAEAVRLRQRAWQAGEAPLASVLEARRAAQDLDVRILSARITSAQARIDLGLATGTFLE